MRPKPREPIAIVGIGCRFPGGIVDAEGLWDVLRGGLDVVGEVPPERFDARALLGTTPGEAGRLATASGGFLEDLDRFDAPFFGLSPREALTTDPQQRLLATVAWEALEDAGLRRADLPRTATGLWFGLQQADYERRVLPARDALDAGTLVSVSRTAAVGRMAAFLGVTGPALTVDSDRSSSLVALHLACQSLETGESEVALVGASNAIVEPEISIALSRSGMMAPGGRCRFGDRDAEGMVRSEGVCVLALMSRERAVAQGLEPRAVILASAVRGEGGASGDVLRPSSPSQLELLRAAWEAAGADPREAGYVEAHGTGTRVGDDAEVAALVELLGPRGAAGPTPVGSVKTHLGHCEAAGGLAGLVAAALALRRGEIPPSLHAEHPIPALCGDETPLVLAAEPSGWPAGRRRLAGVSSFGLTGTLAHVVLSAEASPPAQPPPPARREDRGCVLSLSAHDRSALAELARRSADLLDGGGVSAIELCRAAAHRREPLARRLVACGPDGPALARILRAHAADEEPEGLAAGAPLGAEEQGVVMVFPGQGSQWVGMGAELFEGERAFREVIEACSEVVRVEAGWSLVDELRATAAEARLERIEIIQPLLVAVMIGLARLWGELGVRPAAVCGTSLGEIAAACACGALSLEDAMALACRRVGLMASLGGGGAMAAVALTIEEAREAIGAREGHVGVAVHNSTSSQVIGGAAAEVGEIVSELEAREVFVRSIRGADLASHSPHMDPILDRFEASLADLSPREAVCPMISTVSGERLAGPECDAAYWRSNLRRPVDLRAAVERILADGRRVFLEVSPHPLLAEPIAETAHEAGERIACLPTLERDEPAWARMTRTFAALHVHGCAVDWAAVHPRAPYSGGLPTYPWQAKRYWLPPLSVAAVGTDGLGGEGSALGEGGVAEGGGAPDDPEGIARLIQRRLCAVLALDEEADPDTPLRALGLTSLLATELRSRLERAFERSLSPVVLREHPTVRCLTEHLAATIDAPSAEGDRASTAPAPARAASRPLPLLPAQATSLGIASLAERGSVPFPVTRVLGVRGRLESERVERTLELLIARHEALRVRLVPTPVGWRQELAPEGSVAPPLSIHEVAEGEAFAATLARVAEQLRAGLDLREGRLFAAGLVEAREEEGNALVLVLDHLITDLAGERLLVGDFRELYRRLTESGRAVLPGLPGSLAAWAAELAAGLSSGAHDEDAGAWMADAARESRPFPPVVPDGDDGRGGCVVETLERVPGERLAEGALRSHGADLPALVLGATAEVLTRRAGGDVCINVSSAGRLCPAVETDASRTLGFFAIGHPTFFEPTGAAGGAAAVAAAREAYGRTERRVPMHAFRCHRPTADLLEAFDALQAEAGVVFNYRGELASFVHPPLAAEHLERLGETSTGPGDVVSVVLHGEPVLFGRTRLNVVAGIVDGILTLWVAYPERALGEAAARELAREILGEVERLVGEGE